MRGGSNRAARIGAVAVACGQDKFRCRRGRRVTEIKSAALKCSASAKNFSSSWGSEWLANLLSVAGLTWKKSMPAPTHHEKRVKNREKERAQAKPLREILRRIFICS